MENELQNFAEIIKPLNESELKCLLFALTSSLYYGISVHLVIREIETVRKIKPIENIMYPPPSPNVIKDFFYSVDWHNQGGKKSTKRAIQLVIDRLFL